LLIKGRMVRTVPRSRGSGLAALIADFCNKIGTEQRSLGLGFMSGIGGNADLP
jgi:hypothetical protein